MVNPYTQNRKTDANVNTSWTFLACDKPNERTQLPEYTVCPIKLKIEKNLYYVKMQTLPQQSYNFSLETEIFNILGKQGQLKYVPVKSWEKSQSLVEFGCILEKKVLTFKVSVDIS